MDNQIENALNILYQRGITSRDQLLSELLRVKLVKKTDVDESKVDELFDAMKKLTEEKLGFFQADRSDFAVIYHSLKDIDLSDFVLSIYKEDRSGTVVTPKPLLRYIRSRIDAASPQNLLITEAERHLAGLELITEGYQGNVTLTTQNKLFYELINLMFSNLANISIRLLSIYSPLPDNSRYDYIFCLPAFGGKVLWDDAPFLTQEFDSIALENMLSLLEKDGILDCVMPAKITFSSTQGHRELRALIADHYGIESLSILPEGTFRPWTNIKTYLLSVRNASANQLTLGELTPSKNTLLLEKQKHLSTSVFRKHEDWRIEMLLSGDDENLVRFRQSKTPKVKLKEVADVFRGKSILKKDASVGEIAVLNISNIDNGDIRYEDMDTIQDEPLKVKRYELETGDVVLSSRGTALKSAVFTRQDRMTIASANVIVLRPHRELLPRYIQLFLDGPVGRVMINSFQRGMTIMNLNYTDIMEMEIPLLPLEKQQEIVQTFESEKAKYQAAVQRAETRFGSVKAKLLDEIL